jgi:integrase/recombinase XerD
MKGHLMKLPSLVPIVPASHDVISAHMAAFMAELEAMGYARNTLWVKRVTLERFLSWRSRRKRNVSELTESEISEFLTTSPQGDKSRRSVASRALLGFLDYLRRCQVVTTCVPEPPETVHSGLIQRYADFLREEKGLAELSLKVYLPVANDLLQYLGEEHGIQSVRQMDAALLRTFLFERMPARSSECVRLLATSLRSFLRFLHLWLQNLVGFHSLRFLKQAAKCIGKGGLGDEVAYFPRYFVEPLLRRLHFLADGFDVNLCPVRF